MSNPNFVNDLVMMAKAYEELPGVKVELDAERTKLVEALNNIQRLELRLIDSANELADARSATHKAEVERDHAETMFLETDDKLNAMRRLFAGFTDSVNAFTAASEPQPQPELSAVAESATPNPTPTPDTSHYAPVLDLEHGDQSATDPIATSGANDIQSGPVTDVTTDASATSISDVAPPEVAPTADPTLEVAPAIQPSPANAAEDTLQVNVPMPLDIGYHNEPGIASDTGLTWYDQMIAKYGSRDAWPERPMIEVPTTSQT